GSTLFLKGVIVLLGAVVFFVCLFVLPPMIKAEMGSALSYSPLLLGLYVTAVPFFFALHQALRLLGYIDKNNAFSQASVKTLKLIKYCAIIISILFATAMPYAFYVANGNNTPGIIMLGMVVVFSSIVIATFAAVLQKLLQNAAKIKSENDLMI
ncbi:MAG: DUF2975 domain-containing protein, partial [Candidatus Moraniibacteriota bacterium]